MKISLYELIVMITTLSDSESFVDTPSNTFTFTFAQDARRTVMQRLHKELIATSVHIDLDFDDKEK